MEANKVIQALIFFLPFLFSLSFHEAAHAYMAGKRGDPTARLLGRVTLNPIPHIDILGTVIFPLIAFFYPSGFLFGWAKPVPVNPLNLRNYKKDNLLISIAGPASNLLLALLFTIALKLVSIFSPDMVFSYFSTKVSSVYGLSLEYPFISMLDVAIILNITLALFNLIPVPPLDGSHVLEGILPDRFSSLMERYHQMGFVVFMALLLSGVLRFLSYPIVIIYVTLIRAVL